METGKFLRIALPTPLRRLFDYLPPQDVDLKQLIPGSRVRVPFQSRTLVGLLIEVTDTTSVPYGKLKPALEVLDKESLLPDDIYKLCHWAADYYHYALGEVLMAAMPVALRKGKAAEIKKPISPPQEASSKPLALNEAQALALTAINEARETFKVFLLDGVTGSGKTEVYLQAMENVLAAGKQVLVLVPEISLTPQTISRFQARFSLSMVTLHSGMSEQERLRAWLLARNGQAKIVIGTRSAIFTPFATLGLVIVDEEHDNSFKQQDRFRYHARDLAIMRANLNQVPVVLGSATPSLESLLNVKRHRYTYLSLPERAGNAQLPHHHIVDIGQHKVEEGLSQPLIQAMREHLQQGNQVLLFLNRRGFAPVLYCTECAWIAGCKRCDTRLVYHRKPLQLHCHHCDSRKSIPKRCEQCEQESLLPVGVGTQRLEQILQEQFPANPVIRIDRDNTRRKNAMNDLLEQVNQQQASILLGTQMLAKGHHFPHVTLVGVIDADGGLFSADFRAAEQMGQLLVQVSGRAGREEKPGTVVIQTRHPDHPFLQTLIHQGYHSYAQVLLAEREQSVLPPFSYFAVFRAEAYVEEKANHFLTAIKKMGDTLTDSVTVLGPVPTIMTKRKGLYCHQLIVRSNRRSALQSFLKGILQKIDKLSGSHPVKWVLDVDPLEVV